MKIREILSYLEGLYPPDTACDFDNVGLLVGDGECDVSAAVVALDCDVNALAFAKENGANLIITHHPVILEPLKSVTESDIVFKLIKEGVSVISMHTNLDVGVGGVNDALCDALKLTDIKPYPASDGYLLKSGKTDKHKPDELARHIKECLGGAVRYVAGKRDIENVLVCSGSGGSYIDEAINAGFDALITADVKQHVFVAAINAGISLFDGGHFCTENVVVEPLCEVLKKRFSNITFTPYMPKVIKTI